MVAYCLAMVITLITVGLSAYRVSRLNIVSAVRDLPNAPMPISSNGWREAVTTLLFHFRRIAATPHTLLTAMASFRLRRVVDVPCEAVMVTSVCFRSSRYRQLVDCSGRHCPKAG